MAFVMTIDVWAWFYLLTTGVLIYLCIKSFIRSLKLGGFHHRHVVITGCDSGFGYLLALRLDDMGFSVFACCLTKEGLERIKDKTSYRISPILLDVTTEPSITNAVNTVADRIALDKAGLWALVNNAGIAGPIGPMEWMTNEDYLQTLSVNLFGMIETTRQFLPLLRRGKGRVINMSSANGSVTVPFFLPYTISKYGVEVFSDSLRPEAYAYGVSVHIIKPGMFETNIRNVLPVLHRLNKSRQGLSKNVRRVYGEKFFLKFQKMLFEAPKASNACYKVVDAYLHAITARYPRYRYYVGWDARTLWWTLGVLPEALTDLIYYGLLPSPDIRKMLNEAPKASNACYKVVDAYLHAITARYPRYRYYVDWDAKTLWWTLGVLPEALTDLIYFYRLQTVHCKT